MPAPRRPRPGCSSVSSSLCGGHPEGQETPTLACLLSGLARADNPRAAGHTGGAQCLLPRPPNWGRPGPDFSNSEQLRALARRKEHLALRHDRVNAVATTPNEAGTRGSLIGPPLQGLLHLRPQGLKAPLTLLRAAGGVRGEAPGSGSPVSGVPGENTRTYIPKRLHAGTVCRCGKSIYLSIVYALNLGQFQQLHVEM